MKQFTDADVISHGSYERIYCDQSELVYSPPEWMRRGLQESRTGYGARLNSGLKIHYNGKLYRLYTTIYSNNGTTWFTVKGRKICVS